MAGYSTTPLGRKPVIKPGLSVFLTGMPADIRKGLAAELTDVKIVKDTKASEVDFMHAFVLSKAELKKGLRGWKKSLKKTGALWISWPKKTSSLASDLSGDFVRETGLESGLVDIKVCAVSEDWSGLKFVYRLKDR